MRGKPNIVVIIQARMGSTRLPGKVLMEVCGKPLLQILLEQLAVAKMPTSIVVATSVLSQDDAIEEFCKTISVSCFRGSEEDVLERYWQAAKAYDADIIVRVTGDCPLLDPSILDKVISTYLESQVDYASNTQIRTFPRGLDCEVFSFEALDRAHREAVQYSHREHVTPYIWSNPDKFTLASVSDDEDFSSLRWTVDTPEDLELVTRLLEAVYVPGIPFYRGQIHDVLDRHPEWNAINQTISQKPLG